MGGTYYIDPSILTTVIGFVIVFTSTVPSQSDAPPKRYHSTKLCRRTQARKIFLQTCQPVLLLSEDRLGVASKANLVHVQVKQSLKKYEQHKEKKHEQEPPEELHNFQHNSFGSRLTLMLSYNVLWGIHSSIKALLEVRTSGQHLVSASASDTMMDGCRVNAAQLGQFSACTSLQALSSLTTSSRLASAPQTESSELVKVQELVIPQ